MLYENENTEFKSALTGDIYKEVIAFANNGGGVIYIGVDDNGNEIGVADVDETYTRLTNGIRDAISPDVTVFCKYSLNENNVIKIEISEGARKPYYLKSKGIKPSGVYVRQGASSVPASEDQIRLMIKMSDGDSFEGIRSLNQELTFVSAKQAFEKYGVEFSENKYRVLGITTDSNDLYTNLGLLLSDQCKHSIKAAVFADEDNTSFLDSKEFTGSILRQLDDAYSYLMLNNRNNAEFKGLERVEHYSYPQEALREALLNALVHRDYAFSGSIIININESQIEFISLGGLLPGLSAEDIQNGISQPRNPKLAEVFHRLRLIESYGTGIRRIFTLYRDCEKKPEIIVTPNTFKLILPNRNYYSTDKSEEKALNDQQRTILQHIERNGAITEETVQKLLGVKRTRAYVILKEMRDSGLIEVQGRGQNKTYTF
ncbi:RNA-binding domain-containing protein [uncultured Ruminococcus sp.]|uniref:RNA-binding domain-containing protein n=1 Tax=uncultured Ruminococcus sp. TaxID=165186 RepID=UPI002930D6F1|nr:RNA-binding domain-containing protein [uncultured Ruminococcus sp.]